MKLSVENFPPSFPIKKASLAAVVSEKNGSTMKPLLFYKVIAETVRN